MYLGLENQSHHSKEVFFLSQRKPLFQVSVFSAGRLSPEVHSTILMRIPGIQAVAVLDAATPWTAARQAPLSMGFSRQEYWSGLPYPPPGDLPDPRIEPRSPELQADSLLPEL